MNGGYGANGAFRSPNRNPYDYNARAETDGSARRAKGYGDLGSPERRPQNRHLTPDAAGLTVPGRNAAVRRSGDYRRWSTNQDRSTGRAEKQLEDILRYIKETWPFMAEGECVPVQVALQLLDDSSLGLASRHKEFQDAQMELQRALRAIVNEHHQGFNSSIGTFHQIQASIQSSHDRIRILRESLVEAKSNLTIAKPEFKSLSASSQNYASMLEVLDMIEDVQQIPTRLEALVTEKRFLAAVDTLQEGLALVAKPELDGIDALGEIRVYLKSQETSLADIMSEELQNHLYLKSPYCENRWMAYAQTQSQGKESNAPTGTIDFAPRQMFAFLDDLDTSVPPSDDASRNPEAESFHYIYLLTESLSKLGRLDEAIEDIEQRMPVELFNVAEKTNNETHARHPTLSQTQNSNVHGKPAAVSATDTASDYPARAIVLNDLTQTLYAKFEAIAESHRVFHDVLVGISRREVGYNNAERTNNFKGLWNLYQSEMRTLLHDYLSTQSASHGAGLMTEGNIFRYQREKSKRPAFKMEHLDQSDQTYKLDREELATTWQKFVPGYLGLDQQDLESSKAVNSVGNGNGNGNESSLAGHKLLVEPSVFNISCLLPTSITFLQRLKEIVPANSGIVVSALTTFLSEFMINVFHPQLEETMTDVCAQSFMLLDAFQQETQWDLHSSKPIFKGAVRFLSNITTFCRMLDHLDHDQMFSQLVIAQMNTYYDRCVAWCKALTSRAQPKPNGTSLKAAAAFAEEGPISSASQEIWLATKDGSAPASLVEHETLQLLEATTSAPLDASDLLSDRKAKVSLCLLYNSLRWLASKLKQLKYVSPKAQNQHTGMKRDSNPRMIKRSLTNALSSGGDDEGGRARLPLSDETAALFDGLVDGFDDLATLVLRTLHLEFRCHMIYSLSTAFVGSYVYEEVVEEPDETVLHLINDFIDFEQEISAQLPEREYLFLTTGACSLLDELLARAFTENIQTMNAAGCQYMSQNTKVLRQTLQNLERGGAIKKATRFLELFERGPDFIVADARSGKSQLSQASLKAVLRLRYSEEMQAKDRENAARAGKLLHEYLAQIG